MTLFRFNSILDFLYHSFSFSLHFLSKGSRHYIFSLLLTKSISHISWHCISFFSFHFCECSGSFKGRAFQPLLQTPDCILTLTPYHFVLSRRVISTRWHSVTNSHDDVWRTAFPCLFITHTQTHSFTLFSRSDKKQYVQYCAVRNAQTIITMDFVAPQQENKTGGSDRKNRFISGVIYLLQTLQR